MRIAIIAEVFLPKVDGVVIRTMNLIRELLAQGDEILVVCPAVGQRGECPVATLEFRSFEFPVYPEYLVGIPDQRLVEGLLNFRPDILHFINPFAFGFCCLDFLDRRGVSLPTVFSFHTLYGDYAKRYGILKPLSRIVWWLMRDYHNRAHTNLTVSAAMQQYLTERGFERVELWPPAVDCKLFHPQKADPAMRSRLSSGHPEQPLLLTVSRLAPEKSVEQLAEILRLVPTARLAIVGDGPLRNQLEQHFAQLPANFLGYLKGEELARAYASADVFLFASETETMGNVVLEAMASGLAVVAPRAGGIQSLVADAEDGLLYAAGNLHEAGEKVRQLLGDTSLRAKLGAAARNRASLCDWSHAAATVRSHYTTTIAAHQQHLLNITRSRLAPAVLNSLLLTFRAASALRTR